MNRILQRLSVLVSIAVLLATASVNAASMTYDMDSRTIFEIRLFNFIFQVRQDDHGITSFEISRPPAIPRIPPSK